MENEKILKILVYSGGIVEITVGIMFIFMFGPMLQLIGIPNFMLSTHIAGYFALLYGSLLIFAARDPERYAIVIILNTILRFLVQISAYLSVVLYPTMGLIIIILATYDLAWAILTLIFLYKCDLLSLSKLK